MRLVLVLAFCASALEAQEDPCKCRDSTGGRVALGDTACLTVGGKMFTARCAMSLNLLTWRKLADGCATAQGTPPITSGGAADSGQTHL